MKQKEKTEYSVSVGVLIQMAQYLKHVGTDIDKFIQSIGLDPDILKLPDERIPVEKYIEAEDKAALLSGDLYFGLHMGQYAEAGYWSILGYMMMNCKTIGEAFAKSAKYTNIIGNLIKGEIKLSEQTATILLTVPENSPFISRHCYEGSMSSLISLARTLSGKNINPVEVGFTYPQPESTEEYDQFFQSPVLFDQKSNYMVMDKSVADIPVLLPNENLLLYFENIAKEFLAKLDAGHTITYEVKKFMLAHMDKEQLSIKRIAKELTMSVRALQLNLKNEGTEFSKLLQETREELAKNYINKNYTIEDITFLLGFSEPASFRKAFKKWTGITPKEYRMKLSLL